VSLADQIETLQERAAEAARAVGMRIDDGASPDALVAELRQQLECVTRLQDGVTRLQTQTPGSLPPNRLAILRKGAETLASLTDANHEKATRKGIRLTPRRIR